MDNSKTHTMRKTLLLSVLSMCLAFAVTAQDNYIRFVMGGKKFNFSGQEVASMVTKPSTDLQKTRIFSEAERAPLNVSINFVTKDGSKPTAGTPLLTSNVANMPTSAFVDMTIADGRETKYYTTLGTKDGSVTITSAKDGVVEGKFSVIVNEDGGEDRWELIDGAFRLAL
jgi:hypothetical protein